MPLDPILTTPSGPSPGTVSGSTGPGGNVTVGSGNGTGGNKSGSGSGGTGGSGSGGDPNDPGGYRKKAGKRYLEQARNLEVQARALKLALNSSFGKALHQKLQNVNEVLGDQQKLAMLGYRERVKSLENAAADNEKSAATQTGINAQNLVRERNSALGEAMAQGAGESDILAAQMMSLRNWNANQAEITRGKFDTLTSINSGLTDLTIDTKTSRINNVTQANADREMLWTNFYNQRSEALTQLGNTYGQMADYQEYAKEYGVGGGGGKAKNLAAKAFMGSAKAAGKAWENPGVSKKLMNWDGRDAFEAGGSGSRLAAAPSVDLGAKRPEGATLRKW